MAVIVESNKVTIILVNSGSGNNGTSKIPSDVFDNNIRIAFVRFCINVETFFMFFVAKSFDFFKRRADLVFHFVEQSSTEGIAQEGIVEIIDVAPKGVVTITSFRDEAVDVRIPFKIPAEGMQNHDKAGSEIHGLVLLEKHTRDNTVYGMKKAVK